MVTKEVLCFSLFFPFGSVQTYRQTAMSTSCKPKPRCCDMQRDIHRLLLAAQAAHKADIFTYSSGHLGPRSMTQSQLHKKTKQPFWRMSQIGEDFSNVLTLQQRQTEVLANKKKGEMKDSLFEFTPATALVESKVWGPRQEDATDSSSQADRKEETSPPKMVLSTSDPSLCKPRSLQTKSLSSEEEEQQRLWCRNSRQVGLTKKDQREMMQQFGRQAVGKQDLWKLNCMPGRKAAEMHERKLQKELKKLSVQSWPSRDRLAVFSDVFDDVCEGSPVFGRILREIKTEYDLYLNYIMASHSSLQDTSLNTALEELDKSTARAEELEEAEQEVSRLEEEARRALEDNDRVRNELQNAKAMIGEEDRDSALSGQWQDDGAGSIQPKRLQLWNVWKEIQQLEKEIKEEMVSTDITTITERCIRDSKAQIVRLIASNDRLKTINKDLENNINVALNREKASEALRQQLWDKIWCGLQTEDE